MGIYILLLINIILLLVILAMFMRKEDGGSSKQIQKELEKNLREIRSELDGLEQDMRKDISVFQTNTLQFISTSFTNFGDMMLENQKAISGVQDEKLEGIYRQFQSSSSENEQKLENIRKTMDDRLAYITKENTIQMNMMRETVDEKLQKTLNDRISQSFKLVNERLEQVYKGLGEMQTLATGVGDLKKILTNVKTRGILGEIQLGSILEEVMAPEQYEENVRTRSSGNERVEFAVKLPGANARTGYEGQGPDTVYLPIDSKFPGTTYARLLEAYETGDKKQVEEASKALERVIKSEAKDIRDKYIEPPYTTDFGIMFLPFEGLYAEVVRSGLVEVLQREYKVNVAGPTTMAALLNSLQMGFRTLAIQKHSGEVWQVLGAVKTEFDRFAEVLDKTRFRINQANDELDKLVGVRTRQIQSKLKGVTALDSQRAESLIGTDGETGE